MSNETHNWLLTTYVLLTSFWCGEQCWKYFVVQESECKQDVGMSEFLKISFLKILAKEIEFDFTLILKFLTGWIHPVKKKRTLEMCCDVAQTLNVNTIYFSLFEVISNQNWLEKKFIRYLMKPTRHFLNRKCYILHFCLVNQVWKLWHAMCR